MLRRLAATVVGVLGAGVCFAPLQPRAIAAPPSAAPPQTATSARASADAPAIFSLAFSAPRYHWGDVARVHVLTSTNTAAAELRVASYTHPLRRARIGLFLGVYHVPLLPPLFRPQHTFVFEVVARNAAGVAARRTVAIPVD